jgi:hypothetical protein
MIKRQPLNFLRASPSTIKVGYGAKLVYSSILTSRVKGKELFIFLKKILKNPVT